MNKVEYWLHLALEDIDVAQIMLKNGKLLYAGFMCHLSVEKALKARVESTGVTPTKIHNLNRLAELGGVLEMMNSEQTELLDILNPMQIEARYPSYKQTIEAVLSADNCTNLIKQTKDMVIWIKKQL